jgi:hypothetical protein
MPEGMMAETAALGLTANQAITAFLNHYAAHVCSGVSDTAACRQGQLDAEGRTLLAGRLLRYERRACHLRHRLCSREAGAVQLCERERTSALS